MNGPRLGLFEPLQTLFGAADPSRATYPVLNILAGASSGMYTTVNAISINLTYLARCRGCDFWKPVFNS